MARTSSTISRETGSRVSRSGRTVCRPAAAHPHSVRNRAAQTMAAKNLLITVTSLPFCTYIRRDRQTFVAEQEKFFPETAASTFVRLIFRPPPVIIATADLFSPIWSGIEVVITALTRNQVYRQRYRGFESHPLRHNRTPILIQSVSGLVFIFYVQKSCIYKGLSALFNDNRLCGEPKSVVAEPVTFYSNAHFNERS